MIVACLLLAGLSLCQEGLEALQVGHVIEVRGAIDAQGRFVAEKVELLEFSSDEALIGTVPEQDSNPARFTLLGQIIETDEETQWNKLQRGSLAGQRVKVEGSWKGPRRFVALNIAPRGEGRDRVAARIDELRKVEGGWEARLMIFSVFLPEGVELVHEKPIEAYGLAKERKVASLDVDEEGRDLNEDDVMGAGFALTKGLVLSGQLEAKPTFEDNFDLDDSQDQDRNDYLFTVRTRLSWTPSDSLYGRAEWRYNELLRDDDRTGHTEDRNELLGETFLQWRNAGLAGLDVAVGRQDFDDSREWIYDQNLDALRVDWSSPSWRLDLALGTTLTDGSERDNQALDWIAYFSNNDRKRELAAWAVYRDIDPYQLNSSTEVEEQNLHLGLRAVGEFLPQNESWSEFAYLTGSRDVNNSGSRDVGAWGYDAGTTWSPPVAEPLYFTLGYALGNGDASTSGSDGTFRQTGLQDNTAKFGGVTSFQYYGELMDPELSNMGILTVGAGARLIEKTSLDLVYHQYTQDVPKDELSFGPVESNLRRAKLSGHDADLGSELDLIFGYRRYKSWDLEIVGAWFDPGNAFDVSGVEPGDAFLVKIQLRYRF